MNKNGFRKSKLKTTGISLTRIRTSLKYSKESLVSATSTDEKIRTTMDKNRMAGFLKRFTNGVLDIFSIGNSLKGWYIKK
jgi:hypothetical protein